MGGFIRAVVLLGSHFRLLFRYLTSPASCTPEVFRFQTMLLQFKFLKFLNRRHLLLHVTQFLSRGSTTRAKFIGFETQSNYST